MRDTTGQLRGPGLRVEGLCLDLGRTRVLSGVELTVRPGEIHAIVGPNGGGKSSLIRCLLGQAPHRGRIEIAWPGAPGRLGYVPQALQFDTGLPIMVADFLATLDGNRPSFLPRRAGARARVEERLALVGLAGKAGRRMGALSGGERQRVLMAQALAPAPDLLILDEPMAALDEAGAGIVLDLLAGLRDEGVTVIWVEHDLAAVRARADRVTALSGRVLFSGPPREELTAERVLTLFSHRKEAAV